VLLGVTLTLWLAGCSSGGGSDKATSSAQGGAGTVQQEPAAPAAAGDGRGDAAGQAKQADQANQAAQAEKGTAQDAAPGDEPTPGADTRRSIIYTGTITLRVKDVGTAASAAATIATGAGGSVSGDERSIDAGRSQATVVLRVPSARFASVLDALNRGLDGKEESRAVKAEDVTDQIVDLDARVATAQASVDRVRALMAKAQSLSEVVSLESELSRREANLNSLLQRRTKLADLADLSTITVVLLGPQAKTAKPAKRHESGFVAGLKAGWNAFTGSLVVLLTIAGALLPWLVAIGLVALGVIIPLRRTGRRRTQAPHRTGSRPEPAAPARPEPEPAQPEPAQPEPAGPPPATAPATPTPATDPGGSER
jgi:hypothetical protein